MANRSSNGKIMSSNSFEGGLVADLHKLVSPKNSAFDALNMEIITTGENQYMYQNIAGDKWIMDFPKTEDDQHFFIPLGIKIHNSIAYILTGAFDIDGNFIEGAIGTFPSPDWSVINDDPTASSSLRYVYSELHNYKKEGGTEYTDPFISKLFNFQKNRFIDMEIQADYDGSVNILFTDELNNLLIINSRFKRVELSDYVKLADRIGTTDSNVYSDADWDRIALIQNSNYPVTVKEFKVDEGGYLRGGGYRYYFKYTTQEGNTTELLYESPLIPIANGILGLTKDQVSDKLVRFILTDLDSSYTGVKVYFAHFDGKDIAQMELFTISAVFSYTEGASTLIITHTGLEEVEPISIEELNTQFSTIDTVASISIISDRLAIGGVSSSLSESDINILSEAAKQITLTEQSEKIDTDYSDPNTAANKLGYWKGETYEFGVVFLLIGKGVSPVFPITGMDNLKNKQNSYSTTTVSEIVDEVPEDIEMKVYPPYTLDLDGFDTTVPTDPPGSEPSLINNKGVFRTANSGPLFERNFTENKDIRTITYVRALTNMLYGDTQLRSIVSGFFFVRRIRIKNVLMQGMAVPTLKLPSKYPVIAEDVKSYQTELDCAKRYCIKHDVIREPTIGLNAKFQGMEDYVDANNREAIFNEDFDMVFVPQPTQLINTITFDKSWFAYGSLSQDITSTEYRNTITRLGEDTKKSHVAFYSAELDLNFANIEGHLNGINPQLEIQNRRVSSDPLNQTSPVAYTYSAGLGQYYTSASNLVTNIFEPIDYDRALFQTIKAKYTTATLMDSGQQVYANNAFTAKTDRALSFASDNVRASSAPVDPTLDGDVKGFGLRYYPFAQRTDPDPSNLPAPSATERAADYNILSNDSKHNKTGTLDDSFPNDARRFYPYSSIGQSYSVFLGLEIDTSEEPGPVFNYHRIPLEDLSGEYDEITEGFPDDTDIMYLNTGHLTNVFRSSTGRWKQSDLVNIYKYDSNDTYYAVTDRIPLVTESVPIYRGDGFISRIYKRTSYKVGVPESQSATSADAATFGIGITESKGLKYNEESDAENFEKVDKGRGLFDVGQILEIASFSNINADIRSTEHFSDVDSSLHGFDRDFYPNRKELFGDSRPDSIGYNQGYTGIDNPISYSRLEENSPSYSTEFPNRIMLSDKNQTQSFFNSFRDLNGFNFRDYGTDLGRIVKIMSIRNVLLSIHPTGVLAIGIDQRTMMGEGADIYVDNAEALSEYSKVISDIYGSTNPESIVRTENTIAGVDYNNNAVWLYEGDKLNVVSEFAIKTILERFKKEINNSMGIPKIYSSYNTVKHTLIVTYVSENPSTKKQTDVGTVVYNTVDGKWVSRMEEGTKFAMSLGSVTYSTGITNEEGIWEEEALTDGEDGPIIYSHFKGVDCTYEFEFTLNEESRLQKILETLDVITNKVLPAQIVYTTSGDDNDAATNLWEQSTGERVVTQDVITRNNTTRINRRLGILDENAYYKNSGLYIQVGKMRYDPDLKGSNKRIRDKAIRVRFIYTGNSKTFIQGIISTLSISYS